MGRHSKHIPDVWAEGTPAVIPLDSAVSARQPRSLRRKVTFADLRKVTFADLPLPDDDVTPSFPCRSSSVASCSTSRSRSSARSDKGFPLQVAIDDGLDDDDDDNEEDGPVAPEPSDTRARELVSRFDRLALDFEFPHQTNLIPFSSLPHRNLAPFSNSLPFELGSGQSLGLISQGLYQGYSPQPYGSSLRKREGTDDACDVASKRSRTELPASPMESVKDTSRFACPLQAMYPRLHCFSPPANPQGGCPSISKLTEHIRQQHDPTHTCNQCGREFKSAEKLVAARRADIMVQRREHETVCTEVPRVWGAGANKAPTLLTRDQFNAFQQYCRKSLLNKSMPEEEKVIGIFSAVWPDMARDAVKAKLYYDLEEHIEDWRREIQEQKRPSTLSPESQNSHEGIGFIPPADEPTPSITYGQDLNVIVANGSTQPSIHSTSSMNLPGLTRSTSPVNSKSMSPPEPLLFRSLNSSLADTSAEPSLSSIEETYGMYLASLGANASHAASSSSASHDNPLQRLQQLQRQQRHRKRPRQVEQEKEKARLQLGELIEKLTAHYMELSDEVDGHDDAGGDLSAAGGATVKMGTTIRPTTTPKADSASLMGFMASVEGDDAALDDGDNPFMAGEMELNDTDFGSVPFALPEDDNWDFLINKDVFLS